MGRGFGKTGGEVCWSVDNFDSKEGTEIRISIVKKCSKKEVLKALVFVFFDILRHTKF
jgi:hypothetical protein